MNKNDLRKAALLQRQQYSKEDCQSMSARIAHHFFNNTIFTLTGISYLHIFLPIENKNEVDTYPIFHRLLEQYPFIKIVLSRCDFNDCALSHFVFKKNTELKKNRYGIPEPVTGEEIEALKMDMVLVPLLVVDRLGNRIGYGQGFYDRFLAACRPDCKKVGFSFEEPIDQIPSESFDIPMDFCVTPRGIYNFNLPENSKY